jgi:non-specific serine/threonine protein kinase
VACDRGDRSGAAARFLEGLQVWQQLGTRERLANWLAGVGTLAATCQAAEQAARYFGAAKAMRDFLGYAFVLPERSVFERGTGTARTALGETAFAAAWAAGQALPLDQVIAEASAFLSSLREPDPSTQPRGAASNAGLTRRELDVLRLLVAGRSDREIAAALFIGQRTVQSHVASILGKLGVHRRHDATQVARERHLV